MIKGWLNKRQPIVSSISPMIFLLPDKRKGCTSLNALFFRARAPECESKLSVWQKPRG